MKNLLVFLIRIYQIFISSISRGKCRFVPTCSNYSIEAIKKYGALKGSLLSLRRVLKCHPFNCGGYDPVP